jgi:hypothetical protein
MVRQGLREAEPAGSAGERAGRAVVESGELRAVSLLTGAAIGGKYTAINSTIQELPARYRGWTDLAITRGVEGVDATSCRLDPPLTAAEFRPGAARGKS